MSKQFSLTDGLSMRPARDSDKPFIAMLHHSTRDDLRLIDGENDFIEALIEQQHYAQTVGYGEAYPNAMYFIVEKQSERIGRIIVNFGHTEIHLIDLALIPQARGLGYGKGIIQALQYAASAANAPLTLAVNHINFQAKALYLKLGFQTRELTAMYEYMIWYPNAVEMNKITLI